MIKVIVLLFTFLAGMFALILACKSFTDGEYQMVTIFILLAIYLHGLLSHTIINEKLDNINKKTSK